MKFTPRPVALTQLQHLHTLVENRTVFTLDQCELNIYETHRQSENVALYFNDFVFTSMLRGKKVMRLEGHSEFDYLPGESVIMPPGKTMNIDFPLASEAAPTQCIALSIDQRVIKDTLNYLNEKCPRADNSEEWQMKADQFFLFNNRDLAHAVNHIVDVVRDNNNIKDALAGLALRELLIRMMQTQARQLFERNYQLLSASNRFAHIIEFIKNNIHERITVDMLSRKAYMSKPNFFRCFRQEFGLSPVEYILQERVQLAKDVLTDGAISVTDAAYQAGFSSVNYFIRVFKAMEGITPRLFQQKAQTGRILIAGKS